MPDSIPASVPEDLFAEDRSRRQDTCSRDTVTSFPEVLPVPVPTRVIPPIFPPICRKNKFHPLYGDVNIIPRYFYPSTYDKSFDGAYLRAHIQGYSIDALWSHTLYVGQTDTSDTTGLWISYS